MFYFIKFWKLKFQLEQKKIFKQKKSTEDDTTQDEKKKGFCPCFGSGNKDTAKEDVEEEGEDLGEQTVAGGVTMTVVDEYETQAVTQAEWK